MRNEEGTVPVPKHKWQITVAMFGNASGQVIKRARENDVLILCLPPHTTYATQPLDCGAFSALKASGVQHAMIFSKKPREGDHQI